MTGPDENPDATGPTPTDDSATRDLDRHFELQTEAANVEAPPPPIVRRGGTFESFRHRDFVWFWFGALVSNVGSWMQQYALGIVVFAFRRSEFDLGLVNFVSGIPVLFLAIAGGALADRVDRRRLLIRIQVVLIAQAAALGFLYNSGRLSSGHPTSALAWVAALGVVAGVFWALQFPAWQAMLPDLVPRESLLNGIALNSAQFQSSRLIGPLVAGTLVVAGAGMGEIFYANAVTFPFVIAALWVIRPEQASSVPGGGEARRNGTLETLLGGLRYALEDRVVGLLLLSTAIMTVFGFPYMTLLPAIVEKSLGFAVNTAPYNRAVAVVMAANGLGAMVGALGVASLPPSVQRNRIIPPSLLAFGGLLLAFSFSRALWLSAVISALAGAALMTTNSLANTSLQATTPPHLRGRVMGLFIMSFLGIMPISGLAFGSVGQFLGPSNAVLIGSIALMAWSLFLVASQILVRLEQTADAQEDRCPGPPIRKEPT